MTFPHIHVCHLYKSSMGNLLSKSYITSSSKGVATCLHRVQFHYRLDNNNIMYHMNNNHTAIRYSWHAIWSGNVQLNLFPLCQLV